MIKSNLNKRKKIDKYWNYDDDEWEKNENEKKNFNWKR